MKTILNLSVIFLTLAQVASAMPVRRLEPVTVKNIDLRGNFMPPVQPGMVPIAFLTVQVNSGGCTSASDFVVSTMPVDNGLQLSVIRTKPDLCEAFIRDGKEVQLRVPVRNLRENIYIANPLRVNDRTSH